MATTRRKVYGDTYRSLSESHYRTSVPLRNLSKSLHYDHDRFHCEHGGWKRLTDHRDGSARWRCGWKGCRWTTPSLTHVALMAEYQGRKFTRQSFTVDMDGQDLTIGAESEPSSVYVSICGDDGERSITIASGYVHTDGRFEGWYGG